MAVGAGFVSLSAVTDATSLRLLTVANWHR